jgi:hypothetical protein
MRTILHAKFGDELPKRSAASDEIPRTRPTQQLRNSVEEFEVALTKARAAWRASRGPTRTATAVPELRGHRTSEGRLVCR